LNLPRLRIPLVLVHGIFGFERIMLGPITLAQYFRGIPEVLRAAGNEVYVIRVHPTAGVDRRASVLARRLAARYPEGKFHLIGHSMGGWDARWLARDPVWAQRIASITTIGTAHRGSALADAARWRCRAIYRWLDKVGWDARGFVHITRTMARRLHEQSPEPRRIPCFSLGGNPKHHEVCWPLRRFHGLLERWEGPNDGLVPLESALAFGMPLPPLPIDHFRQMNWLTGHGARRLHPATAALYRQILSVLADVEARSGEHSLVEQGPRTNPLPEPLVPVGQSILAPVGDHHWA
jgi:triacylglycerol lipase